MFHFGKNPNFSTLFNTGENFFIAMGKTDLIIKEKVVISKYNQIIQGKCFFFCNHVYRRLDDDKGEGLFKAMTSLIWGGAWESRVFKLIGRTFKASYKQWAVSFQFKLEDVRQCCELTVDF